MEFNWQTEDGRLFALAEDNKLLSEATWRITQDGTYVVDYTYVDPSLRGQGVASQLMAQVANHIREKKGKTYGTCSYADIWYRKNRESVSDILIERPSGEGTACKLKF